MYMDVYVQMYECELIYTYLCAYVYLCKQNKNVNVRIRSGEYSSPILLAKRVEIFPFLSQSWTHQQYVQGMHIT